MKVQWLFSVFTKNCNEWALEETGWIKSIYSFASVFFFLSKFLPSVLLLISLIVYQLKSVTPTNFKYNLREENIISVPDY